MSTKQVKLTKETSKGKEYIFPITNIDGIQTNSGKSLPAELLETKYSRATATTYGNVKVLPIDPDDEQASTLKNVLIDADGILKVSIPQNNPQPEFNFKNSAKEYFNPQTVCGTWQFDLEKLNSFSFIPSKAIFDDVFYILDEAFNGYEFWTTDSNNNKVILVNTFTNTKTTFLDITTYTKYSQEYPWGETHTKQIGYTFTYANNYKYLTDNNIAITITIPKILKITELGYNFPLGNGDSENDLTIEELNDWAVVGNARSVLADILLKTSIKINLNPFNNTYWRLNNELTLPSRPIHAKVDIEVPQYKIATATGTDERIHINKVTLTGKYLQYGNITPRAYENGKWDLTTISNARYIYLGNGHTDQLFLNWLQNNAVQITLDAASTDFINKDFIIPGKLPQIIDFKGAFQLAKCEFLSYNTPINGKIRDTADYHFNISLNNLLDQTVLAFSNQLIYRHNLYTDGYSNSWQNIYIRSLKATLQNLNWFDKCLILGDPNVKFYTQEINTGKEIEVDPWTYYLQKNANLQDFSLKSGIYRLKFSGSSWAQIDNLVLNWGIKIIVGDEEYNGIKIVTTKDPKTKVNSLLKIYFLNNKQGQYEEALFYTFDANGQNDYDEHFKKSRVGAYVSFILIFNNCQSPRAKHNFRSFINILEECPSDDLVKLATFGYQSQYSFYKLANRSITFPEKPLEKEFLLSYNFKEQFNGIKIDSPLHKISLIKLSPNAATGNTLKEYITLYENGTLTEKFKNGYFCVQQKVWDLDFDDIPPFKSKFPSFVKTLKTIFNEEPIRNIFIEYPQWTLNSSFGYYALTGDYAARQPMIIKVNNCGRIWESISVNCFKDFTYYNNGIAEVPFSPNEVVGPAILLKTYNADHLNWSSIYGTKTIQKDQYLSLQSDNSHVFSKNAIIAPIMDNPEMLSDYLYWIAGNGKPKVQK